MRVILPGLLLAMLLAMLDAMIVSTALPTVVGDLGGFEHLSWVVTAYLLTTTVSTPLWGKFADIYGKKQILLTAVVIFLVGSALSGLSQSMSQLIAFRAVQGVGAGGLLVGVMTIIGVLVPAKERGRYQSYIAVLSAVATVGGPLVGGLFTDYVSWRWAFYVNVPIGIVALVILAATLHLPRTKVGHRIDYPGALLLAVLATAVVLLCAWGGTQYAWNSAPIIILAVVAVVCLPLVVLAERRAAEPILPPELFSIRNFNISLVLAFVVGIALYGSLTFLPLYEQNVKVSSATTSGLLLLPVLGGMLVASILSGQLMSKVGGYRIYPILGGIGLSVGAFLLSTLDVHTNSGLAAVYMVVFGLGLGFIFQNSLVIAQNSVELKNMGVASGGVTFFRTVGGSFGVALFATIFISRVHDALVSTLPPAQVTQLSNDAGRVDSSALRGLPSAARDAYVQGIAHATQDVFKVALPFFVVAFLVALFVKPMQKKTPPPAPPANDSEPARSSTSG
jgi:EmrB/QacA subfamily drug resistance transporter